ncbi:hypothetical protein [Sodalis ligni]|uniref:Uncharacterized protein n=1 Tax=Sodalis ligni TaxID=2697027 RepID=A0A4R1NLK9_9GAMM|nr:hypothetical protein [Sodalis ligni]TCL06851.1 hypothetical protein EZJ58_5148 [Sodalis ligni]
MDKYEKKRLIGFAEKYIQYQEKLRTRLPVDICQEKLFRIALDALTATPVENPTCTCPSGDGSLRWPCPEHPPAALDDYFASLVSRARVSADKAMRKYPQPNYVLLKVAEEAGEVVQAGVHYAENRMPWQNVEDEITQLLAMLIRLVTEGDQINGITPPESCRVAISSAIQPSKSATSRLEQMARETAEDVMFTADGADMLDRIAARILTSLRAAQGVDRG